MEREILATIMAASSRPEYSTSDRIEALTKGHGMLNIAALCAANAMTWEILEGRDITLTDANLEKLPVDHVVEMGVKAAVEAGALPENAAVITATLLSSPARRPGPASPRATASWAPSPV